MLSSTFVLSWYSLTLYPKQTTKGNLPRFGGVWVFFFLKLRSFQPELPPWPGGRRAAAEDGQENRCANPKGATSVGTCVVFGIPEK